ncbi:hypothetical protein K8R33_04470 [archaeon]|nr:hypothetical protein [archaeon]
MPIEEKFPCGGFSNLEESNTDKRMPCLFNWIQTPQYNCPLEFYQRICAERGKDLCEKFIGLYNEMGDKQGKKRMERIKSELLKQYKKHEKK